MEAENIAEMARLTKQARLFSATTGLLPPTVKLAGAATVLDVGTGPGEWAMAVAQQFPACSVTGIDTSQIMSHYATASAREQKLPNVQFRIMDALQPLSFPDASFDLVHARLVSGFMKASQWPAFLRECFRLLKPGGVICSTEYEGMGITTSSPLTRFNALFVEAMRRNGQGFTPIGEQLGLTAVQAYLLAQAGCERVQQQASVINYSKGMSGHTWMVENLTTGMKLIQPFIIRQKVATLAELESLYLAGLEEMMEDAFCGIIFLHTAWGYKPS